VTRFVILSPSRLAIPNIFRDVKLDARRHEKLFAEMRRFRRAVYLQDGVIDPGVVDWQSWHVLSLDACDRVCACLRFTDGLVPRVGGWAVAESRRFGREGLRVVLATYGLLELLGGRVGIASATVRHGSAGMLKRIGLKAMALPYFSREYGCLMEDLQFDSGHPNPKYVGMVRELSAELLDAPVICRDSVSLLKVAA
jgi:hypothetical protein